MLFTVKDAFSIEIVVFFGTVVILESKEIKKSFSLESIRLTQC